MVAEFKKLVIDVPFGMAFVLLCLLRPIGAVSSFSMCADGGQRRGR